MDIEKFKYDRRQKRFIKYAPWTYITFFNILITSMDSS